VVSVTLPQVA